MAYDGHADCDASQFVAAGRLWPAEEIGKMSGGLPGMATLMAY
jgi:hypothetical protein